MAQYTCKKCGKTGHNSRTCGKQGRAAKPVISDQIQQNNGSSRRCSFCYTPGHTLRTCLEFQLTKEKYFSLMQQKFHAAAKDLNTRGFIPGVLIGYVSEIRSGWKLTQDLEHIREELSESKNDIELQKLTDLQLAAGSEKEFNDWPVWRFRTLFLLASNPAEKLFVTVNGSGYYLTLGNRIFAGIEVLGDVLSPAQKALAQYILNYEAQKGCENPTKIRYTYDLFDYVVSDWFNKDQPTCFEDKDLKNGTVQIVSENIGNIAVQYNPTKWYDEITSWVNEAGKLNGYKQRNRFHQIRYAVQRLIDLGFTPTKQ